MGSTRTAPLVSVVLATRDGATYLEQAVRSVLRQSVDDQELLVVDDGSADGTPALLAAVDDSRLRVLRHERPLGLAASLNHGLDEAAGAYVARMDADDVSLPHRLERQVARIRARAGVAIVGSGVAELDGRGRVGRAHVLREGPAVTRWRALFGTPFLHPTVLLDRSVLDRHGLRYDSAFDAGDASTEDYQLWGRLLDVADGDNIAEPLLLYRRHAGQASARRAGHQLELRRTIATERIRAVAPHLDENAAELAWKVGDGRPLDTAEAEAAVDAFIALLDEFPERRDPAVRAHAARALARVAVRVGRERRAIGRRALRLDPLVGPRLVAERAARMSRARAVRREATRWLDELQHDAAHDDRPVRVVVVTPEPTPYRSPLFDRVARRPEVDLTVVYAAHTVANRTWRVAPLHRSIVLDGVRVPGVRKLLRHDYPITPGVVRALRAARPEVVVVQGWSTFSSQAAILWSRLRSVPYLLLVSSHDAVDRPRWRRAVRRPIVPAVVGGAWGAFALGTLSRASLVANGARPERVFLFANTIDVEALGEHADRLASRRDELRAALGVGRDGLLVLAVGRLAPEKGLDLLVQAVGRSGIDGAVLVIAGEGPERRRLEEDARRAGVRLVLTGDLGWEQLVGTYVAADVFALLSTWEAWGVVVNEAAACGKPLVLSDQVGAAADLLRDGENGSLVPAGDVDAAAFALRALAADPDLRRAAGERSREIVREWGYEPSVASFVAAVRAAAGRPSADRLASSP